MKTRIIQTRFWDDDIVMSVSKDANHLWIFLLTNKDLGMTNYVRIPDAFIQIYTKLTPTELTKAKEELQATRKVFFFKDWVFIPKLEAENRYKNSPSNLKSYNKELSIIPIDVRSHFDSISDTSVNSTVHSSVDSTQKQEIINQKSKIKKEGGVGETKKQKFEMQKKTLARKKKLAFTKKKKPGYWQERASYYAKRFKLNNQDTLRLFGLYKQKDQPYMDRICAIAAESQPSNFLAYVLGVIKNDNVRNRPT